MHTTRALIHPFISKHTNSHTIYDSYPLLLDQNKVTVKKKKQKTPFVEGALSVCKLVILPKTPWSTGSDSPSETCACNS